jgi:outer membrane immunogenic protein
MMRKILLASVALAAVSAPALAADLPSRKYEPAAPVVYAPVFTWTGFYVGLNAGVGFSQSNNTTVTDFGPVTPGTYTYSQGNNNGFVGGAQAGYNWQTGQFVFGVETDIQYADLGNKHDFGGYYYGGSSNNGNYFGTVRGRVGYAFDRALIYVTGGLAYGDIGGGIGNSSTKAGYTVGGGLEYAFTNNWTAKIEGLYVNIDRGNAIYYGPTYTVHESKNTDFGVVRVGLNYKF